MTEPPRSRSPNPEVRYPPPPAVDYPESNGLPLAEARFQYDSLTYAAGTLEVYYRDRPDVAVEGNRLLYYVEGDIHSRVAPDVFVVFGAPKRRRRTYLLWQEPKGPDFVLEVTSRSTRHHDQGSKRDLYARLGVSEYWLFDPTGDWLVPRLQGHRLAGEVYERLPPTGIEAGERLLRSAVLGLDVYVDAGEIRFRDPRTGRKLLSLEETDRAWLEEARARSEADEARQKADLAREEAERAREESERAREQAEHRRQEAALALQEAEARIAELEARRQVEPSSPPNAR